MKPIVINPKAAGQNSKLSALLLDAGLTPVEVPLIGFKSVPAVSPFPRVSHYQGLFFSSSSGVKYFLEQLSAGQKETWAHLNVYTLSPQSAVLAKKAGLNVAFVPGVHSLRGFLKEFNEQLKSHWLHPCSVITRLQPQDFLKKGVSITNYPVYCTICPPQAALNIKRALPSAGGIFFSSGSMVDNFFSCWPDDGQGGEDLARMVVVSLGPSASEALTSHGFTGFYQSAKPDMVTLVDTLKALITGRT